MRSEAVKKRQRAEQQRRYDLNHPEKRRIAYLQRKAAGYYHDTCPSCAGPKVKAAEFCQACSPRLRADLRCEGCGRPRTRYGRHCRSCAQKLSSKTRSGRSQAVLASPNQHCPHEAAPCGLKHPHEHCPSCWEPTRVGAGWCVLCRIEVERGAAMSERDSRRFEEAA